nr:ribose-phosphate pyrophosphokinase [Candidatus Micrarchaeota archaeon]MBU2476974.1 ribose-phosphate pyrophosphokinase [Candidatus Micrarchaeota archaeon]
MQEKEFELKVFSGRANPKLSESIASFLGKNLGEISISDFSDGEINLEIEESVRGHDVFFVQPTSYPTNETMMELLLFLDAAKRASAKRVTAVMPYYGYARQDRKSSPRTPISAKLMADLITVAGANRVLAVDLHAAQIQGFFNIQLDNLSVKLIIADHIKEKKLKDLCIVSPDIGGIRRARDLSKILNAKLAVVDKLRAEPNKSQVMNIIGKVNGKNCVLVDDIIDTAGTMAAAAVELKRKGALSVRAYASHAVLSGKAIQKIMNSPIQEVVVSDSIPLNGKAKQCKKIKVFSIAELLAKAIQNIHTSQSVSQLFKLDQQVKLLP